MYIIVTRKRFTHTFLRLMCNDSRGHDKMNETRKTIITLYSQGMIPKHIARTIKQSHTYVTSTIYYYHKKAEKEKCCFTGDQAKDCIILAGQLKYVSPKLFRLFQAGLTVEMCILILGKAGYVVVDIAQLKTIAM